MLPTGKEHISFSEMKEWSECSYRHKLRHIQKIDLSKKNIFLCFGTAIHASCENFIKTRIMDFEIALEELKKSWIANAGVDGFTEKAFQQSCDYVVEILKEVPQFMDDNFPDWKALDAELMLYEQINPEKEHKFKGFVDAIITCKGKRGEDLVWIIDWKTSISGWRKDKRQDEMIKYQLALYKNFWCKRFPDVPFKNVRCAFVILKKQAKPGLHCDFFPVSIGEVPIQKSLKVVNNMLTSLERNIAIKNRFACKYCDYANTEHCK